jgi:ketosteroid isomerase-like protein
VVLPLPVRARTGGEARTGRRWRDAVAAAAGRPRYIHLDLAGETLIETEAAARRWAEDWARAWREHDSERVAALYAKGASFRSAPFRELQDPKGYADWAFADEDSADVWFAEPTVSGDGATVEWWAVSSTSGGQEETLAGVSLLRFGEDGLVVDQRDYWHSKPGRHER